MFATSHPGCNTPMLQERVLSLGWSCRALALRTGPYKVPREDGDRQYTMSRTLVRRNSNSGWRGKSRGLQCGATATQNSVGSREDSSAAQQ